VPFTERIKLLAKTKAAFRCCVCHKPFVDVHHLIPESKGGPSTIANAAPLCASCHDLYGGNPEKRKALTQMRDHWWRLIEERNKRLVDSAESRPPFEIAENKSFTGGLLRARILLYHRIFPREGFEKSANVLIELVYGAQKHNPNQKRLLFLDIDGHRRKDGRFDAEMAELQLSFLAQFLIRYVTEIHTPLLDLRNKRLQDNNVPERLNFIKFEEAIKGNVDEAWLADLGVLVKIDQNSRVPIKAVSLRRHARKSITKRRAPSKSR
jgi:HNH endonuclease